MIALGTGIFLVLAVDILSLLVGFGSQYDETNPKLPANRQDRIACHFLHFLASVASLLVGHLFILEGRASVNQDKKRKTATS